MARAPLVTVPDEGAAWMVRDALSSEGISVEVERARPDHPYTASALAKPMRLYVAEEDLDHARVLLAALEAEIAGSQDELNADALAAGNKEAPAAALGERSVPRLSWAIALGLILLPLPVVCFYARAWRTGALFAGLYLAGLACMVLGHPGVILTPAAKLADFSAGLPLVVLARRRAEQRRLGGVSAGQQR
jgi:hypothetical protein